MSESDAIVRNLAARREPIGWNGWCSFCSGRTGSTHPLDFHAPDCPWRQAVEFCERNPERDPGLMPGGERPKLDHVPGDWDPEEWWAHVESCGDCSRYYARPVRVAVHPESETP